MPSEQVKAIIERCGVSRNELARRSGLSASVLSRFANGHFTLTLRNLDKLARVLPLAIKAGKLKGGKS